jgi:hypothetical protein
MSLTKESFKKYKEDGKTFGILRKTISPSTFEKIKKENTCIELDVYMYPNGDVVSKSFSLSSKGIDQIEISGNDLNNLKKYLFQLKFIYNGPKVDSNSLLFCGIILD